jgi:hypothetical protein
MEQVDHLLERDSGADEIINVVAEIRQRALIATDVAQPRFVGDNSFESFGSDGHDGRIF